MHRHQLPADHIHIVISISIFIRLRGTLAKQTTNITRKHRHCKAEFGPSIPFRGKRLIKCDSYWQPCDKKDPDARRFVSRLLWFIITALVLILNYWGCSFPEYCWFWVGAHTLVSAKLSYVFYFLAVWIVCGSMHTNGGLKAGVSASGVPAESFASSPQL